MRYNKDFDEIKNIINRLLKRYDLHESLDEINLFQNWRKIVGDNIADYFQPRYIDNEILYVEKKGSKDTGEFHIHQQELILLIRRTGYKIPLKDVKII